MTKNAFSSVQLATIRAARLELLDLGREAAAASLAWAVTDPAPAAAPAFTRVWMDEDHHNALDPAAGYLVITAEQYDAAVNAGVTVGSPDDDAGRLGDALDALKEALKLLRESRGRAPTPTLERDIEEFFAEAQQTIASLSPDDEGPDQ